MPLKRVMTVMRLTDGRLVIHSCIALGEPEMAQLEAWGRPSYLLVPSPYHRIDAGRFKARYPNLAVLCPEGATRRVSKVVVVDGSYGDFPSNEDIVVAHLDGVKNREGVVQVNGDSGTTLIFNDIMLNVQRQKGFWWTAYALAGSTGGPKVSRISKIMLVADRSVLRDHFERLANLPELVSLVPGHGPTINVDPRGVLRNMAANLA